MYDFMTIRHFYAQFKGSGSTQKKIENRIGIGSYAASHQNAKILLKNIQFGRSYGLSKNEVKLSTVLYWNFENAITFVLLSEKFTSAFSFFLEFYAESDFYWHIQKYSSQPEIKSLGQEFMDSLTSNERVITSFKFKIFQKYFGTVVASRWEIDWNINLKFFFGMTPTL